MSKIAVSVPNSDYKSTIDTQALDVELRETFLGVTFVSLSGRRMVVVERDGYFEVVYDKTPPVIHMGVGLG